MPLNLNTSYVKVQHKLEDDYIILTNDLNTSYVKVQQHKNQK